MKLQVDLMNQFTSEQQEDTKNILFNSITK